MLAFLYFARPQPTVQCHCTLLHLLTEWEPSRSAWNLLPVWMPGWKFRETPTYPANFPSWPFSRNFQVCPPFPAEDHPDGLAPQQMLAVVVSISVY